jgi:hypothetical protein
VFGLNARPGNVESFHDSSIHQNTCVGIPKPSVTGVKAGAALMP